MAANTPPAHSDSFVNVDSDRNSPATADGDTGQLPHPGDVFILILIGIILLHQQTPVKDRCLRHSWALRHMELCSPSLCHSRLFSQANPPLLHGMEQVLTVNRLNPRRCNLPPVMGHHKVCPARQARKANGQASGSNQSRLDKGKPCFSHLPLVDV